MPWGGGPPVPLRSCCFPQLRHSRYRLPSGPRRRCQRWSPSLHRQDLAIAASLAMSRIDSMRATVGPMRASPVQARSLPRPDVESSYQPRSGRRSWAEPAVAMATTRTTRSQDRSQLDQARRAGWAKHAGVPLRVSVLLRELGDFSLHPQGRPCGRPSAALRPSSHTTVTRGTGLTLPVEDTAVMTWRG
jgi:hypothetical protein